MTKLDIDYSRFYSCERFSVNGFGMISRNIFIFVDTLTYIPNLKLSAQNQYTLFSITHQARFNVCF